MIHWADGLKYIFENNEIDVKVVYDIGSYKGLWTDAYREQVNPFADMYLFEANTDCKEFAKSQHNVFWGALSDCKREVEFYHNPDSPSDSGESYYRENTVFYKNAVSRSLTTDTLASVVGINNIPPPDLIKIDTQGSELDILRGAGALLKDCSFILLELSLVDYNLGTPSTSELLNFLKANDFMPLDILDIHYVEAYLAQLDILFIKKSVKNAKIHPNDYLNNY